VGREVDQVEEGGRNLGHLYEAEGRLSVRARVRARARARARVRVRVRVRVRARARVRVRVKGPPCVRCGE